MRKLYRILVPIFSVALLAPSLGTLKTVESENSNFNPDVGPLCIAALVAYAVEVGKKCIPDRNAEAQAELEGTQRILDQFILSDPSWDQDRLTRFKQEQGGASLEKDKLCQGDALKLGKGFATMEAEVLRADIEDLVSRYDRAVWGRTCL